MYGKVISACLHGVEGKLIEVEVDLSNGLPMMNIVGLPDSAVKESIERVRAAVKNCGFTFPLQRITVNLAPADIRKEGSAFDLAIALGILETSGQVAPDLLQKTLILGELALDGTIRSVPGVLSMIEAAVKHGIRKVIVPSDNAEEAGWIKDCEVISAAHLRQWSKTFDQGDKMRQQESVVTAADQSQPFVPSALSECNTIYTDDYADVSGQQHVKRALTICAAGMHNIILVGPPGTGKTMLARRLPTIMPQLNEQESLDVTKIYSASGKFADRRQLVRERAFRSPHHTISAAGLVGGGGVPKPGEISLAHRGVLFLDELPEFSRSVLEVLRQPMEERWVTIGRARAVYRFPAHFLLAASMNPCPCGYLGDELNEETGGCICSPLKIAHYRSKISGPLLDRIDLHVNVPRVDYRHLNGSEPSLSSSEMRARVEQAHAIQRARFEGTGLVFNSELNGRRLRSFCRLESSAALLMERSFTSLGLSVRSHDRILKIARTIADLDESGDIRIEHVAEALQYRMLDKKLNL